MRGLPSCSDQLAHESSNSVDQVVFFQDGHSSSGVRRAKLTLRNKPDTCQSAATRNSTREQDSAPADGTHHAGNFSASSPPAPEIGSCFEIAINKITCGKAGVNDAGLIRGQCPLPWHSRGLRPPGWQLRG
jgi:hypothetical protein